MKQNVDVTDYTICLFVCFSASTGTTSELSLLIDKLQRNADKVQKNIYDIEQNLNKVQYHSRYLQGFQVHLITLIFLYTKYV